MPRRATAMPSPTPMHIVASASERPVIDISNANHLSPHGRQRRGSIDKQKNKFERAKAPPHPSLFFHQSKNAQGASGTIFDLEWRTNHHRPFGWQLIKIA